MVAPSYSVNMERLKDGKDICKKMKFFVSVKLN